MRLAEAVEAVSEKRVELEQGRSLALYQPNR